MAPEKYKQQAVEKQGDKVDDYLRLFPGNTNEEIASSLKELSLLQFAAFPAYLWAGFSKNKTYLYQFTHVPVDKPGFPNYGAFHTSEVPFALHTLHLWRRPWRDIDLSVENTMNNYWVNFVKTGDPNGEGLPGWSTYDKISGNILEIGDETKLVPALFKNEFQFLEGSLTDKK